MSNLTSPETKETLTKCAREMFPNFDQFKEEDQDAARIVAATGIRTFLLNWKPNREITQFFDWVEVKFDVIREAFDKFIDDMDKEYL